MDASARQTRVGLASLAGLFAVATTFAGSAGIRDRDAATRVTPVDSQAMNRDAADDPATWMTAPDAGDETRSIRPPLRRFAPRNIYCADCGVVESVTRIVRRVPAGFACGSDDFHDSLIAHIAQNDDAGGGAASLSDIVEGALGAPQAGKKVLFDASHRIVIRLRDGSRRVFNEATARTLRSGERVLVIAGTAPPSR
jgi:hypothetical protein